MYCKYCKQQDHTIEDCLKLARKACICDICQVRGHLAAECPTICSFCKGAGKSRFERNDCATSLCDIRRVLLRMGKFIDILMSSGSAHTRDAIKIERLVLDIKAIPLGRIVDGTYMSTVAPLYQTAKDIYAQFILSKWGKTPREICRDWDEQVSKAIFQGGWGHTVYGSIICHAVVSEEDYKRLTATPGLEDALLVEKPSYELAEKARHEVWGN